MVQKARTLNLVEFKRAEKCAMLTKHPLRNRALLYMSFSLALRACELRRIRIKDILSPDGTLLEEISLLKTMTKNRKHRNVYLTNKKTREVLIEYINYLKAKCAKKKRPFCPQDLLFESQQGGELRKTCMVRIFSLIFKDAGLVNARSHSGRRTFITNKIDEGINLRNIALIVGHESIHTTVGYYEENPNTLKRISEKSIF